MSNGKALNIGCGNIILDDIAGFPCVNVDIRPLDGEHFPKSETRELVKEWSRVLKIGGRIKFRTPSLKWVAHYYLHTGDAEFVSYHIFGGQDYPGNFHYVIFDNKWLEQVCAEFNLRVIDYKEIHSNFELVLVKESRGD